MKKRYGIFLLLILGILSCQNSGEEKAVSLVEGFNIEKDLLLVQFDCKTDVDDLHTAAALFCLLADSAYSSLNYHAVAGSYGIQEGLYVPPNDLFQLAFGDNWSDAHTNLEIAATRVLALIIATLNKQGDIWIADAGQSDFTARLVKAIQAEQPEINTRERFHVVQHGGWNEEVTSPEALDFVKQNTHYQKIPDGNALDNGTPGFRSPDFTNWAESISEPEKLKVWKMAVNISDKYNGSEGRYLNKAIAAGGLDFSDLAEVCWILGIDNIADADQFFRIYVND